MIPNKKANGGIRLENFNKLALTWDNEPRRIERAQAVAAEIMIRIPNLKTMSGFEYGCGTGMLSFFLQPHLKNIILGDNSDGMLDVLRQKIQNQRINNMMSLKVDFETEEELSMKCDMVYTLMTMHHIINIEKVIKVFHKMLNPQGYLCIADLDEEDGSFHGNDFVGHKGFNQDELLKTLESHGFKRLSSAICYQNIRKLENGQIKKYPIFLMITQKVKES